MNDADLWELMTKHGIAPDSATALVQSHKGMADADLWERLVKNGAPADAATQIVTARGGSAAPAAAPATDMSARNMLRSFMQGATFNLGDSDKLPAAMRIDADKEAAFKKDHGVADFMLRMGGGAVAPIIAAAAAPEVLGGLAGAVGLGAATGGISSAAEGKGVSAGDRFANGAVGGVAGAAGGLLGYGASKAAGNVIGSILDRANPSRVVARDAAKMVNPADLAKLAEANKLAPGSASLATTVTPPQIGKQMPMPRFNDVIRGVGANPEAALAAEQALVGQKAAIEAGKRAIGNKMDALPSDVRVTPGLRKTMTMVQKVLGNKHTPELPDLDYRLITEATPDIEIETAQAPHPSLREAVKNFWERQTTAYVRTAGTTEQQMAKQGLDRHITEAASNGIRGARTVLPGQPAVFDHETVDTQALRDALGRLRYLARNAEKQGTSNEGPTAYEIKAARNALQDYLYKNLNGLKSLDGDYAKMMGQQRGLEVVGKTTTSSIGKHLAASMTGADASSVGGSLFKGKLGMAKAAANAVLKGPEGRGQSVMSPKMAAVISKYILTPGDGALYNRLLMSGKQFSPRFQAGANGAAATMLPALSSLLHSDREDDNRQ